MDDVLEKLLRMATAASKKDAWSFHPLEIDDPMKKFTQEDLDALRTTFLAEQLDADAVEKMMNDVFQKFAGDLGIDERFDAAVRVLCI